MLYRNAFHIFGLYFKINFILAQVVDESGHKGPNRQGGLKYRWLTVCELTALTNKDTFLIGSNILLDLSELNMNHREHRLCYLGSCMILQIATMGSYGNRGGKEQHFIFPASLIR